MTGELVNFIADNARGWDADELKDLHFALDQLRRGAAACDSAYTLQSLAYDPHTPASDRYPRNSDVLVHAWIRHGRSLCQVLFTQAVRLSGRPGTPVRFC